MKTGTDRSRRVVALAERKSDPAKLVSLLALATGAAAIPQTSNADIIFQSANAHVGFASGDSSAFSLTLSGTAHFGFQAPPTQYATRNSGLTVIRGRAVLGGWTGGAQAKVQGANSLAAPRNQGETWNQGGLALYSSAVVGKATQVRTAGSSNLTNQSPGAGYDHKYYAFQFTDNGTRYGWIEVSLSMAGGRPSLTIYGYAYGDPGVPIAMGAMPVPEPSPAAILALGALTLGAPGLRCWRRQHAATGKS